MNKIKKNKYIKYSELINKIQKIIIKTTNKITKEKIK